MNMQLDPHVKALFDDIVAHTPDVGPTPSGDVVNLDPGPSHQGRRSLAVAAAAVVMVGAGALVAIERPNAEVPLPDRDTAGFADAGPGDSGPAALSPAVHLRLVDDEWRLVFADLSAPALRIDPAGESWAITQSGVASYYSTYMPASGYTDDEPTPTVIISTSDHQATPPPGAIGREPQVVVAGIATPMLTDEAGRSHAVVVDLANGERSTIVLENMTDELARSLLSRIDFMDRDQWSLLLVEPTPTTTATLAPEPLDDSQSAATTSIAPPPTTTTTFPPGMMGYVIVAGDSAAKIAADHGMTVDELAALNSWPDGAEHPIFPGDLILVRAN